MIAVAAARMFPATSERAVDGALVVIGDDGRIVAAGRRGDVPAKSAGEAIEFKDATILPGMIDMHAHLMGGNAEEAKTLGYDTLNIGAIASQVIRGVENARTALLNGVTTIRDVAAPGEPIFRFRRAIESRWIPGPRIFGTGRAIAMTGGHAWNMNLVVEADGPDEVRKAAREQLKLGADGLKLMATGGAGTEGERLDDVQMTVEEMRTAVDEAHKRGKWAAAHATGTSGVMQAIEAGIDSIEHGLMLDKPSVAAMARQNVYYTPTLNIYVRIAERGAEANLPAYAITKAEAAVDAHRRSFKLAMAEGVKIVTGSDSVGAGWPFADVAAEVSRMVDLGMSPATALLAATRTSAECLGQVDEVGTVQPGRWGDLLIVAGNPLEDVGALRRVVAVFKGGERIR
jgi:imidazolonepropionase-like amidohydrolase